MNGKIRRILVAIPTNGSDGRLRLGGIIRYANQKPQWDLKFILSRTAFNDDDVAVLMSDGHRIDGCILAAYTPAVEKLLAAGVPCVAALENLHQKLCRHPAYRAVFIDNAEIGAAEIGKDFVFSSKPSPAFVGAPSWDADAVRNDLLRIKAACDKNGCPVEFILKDISTCCNDLNRLVEWNKIAMDIVKA